MKRTFLISTVSQNTDGSTSFNLMDYHYEKMPTYKEIINSFKSKFPNKSNISIISIMEFNKKDYNILVSET